jgi:hypothetical protein
MVWSDSRQLSIGRSSLAAAWAGLRSIHEAMGIGYRLLAG